MTQVPIKPIFILAGGFGTRLRPVVPDVPKPLAPVNGKPFLLHLIEDLIYQGGQDFILLLHYKSDLIKNIIGEFIKKLNNPKIKITCIIEDMPLGTGGSILNAINKMDMASSFIVVNADTWLGDGLHQINLSPASSLVTVQVEDCRRYGSLILNEHRIVKFLEKNSCKGKGFINAGLYHLNPEIFAQFEHNCFISLENHVFPSLVDQGLLFATEVRGDFIDIGIPEDYFRFCTWIDTGKFNEL